MSQAAAPASSERESDSARRRTEKILEAFHEEERFGRSYDLSLLKRLWPFFRPYRLLIVGSTGVIMLTATGALVRPLVMRRVIDDGVMKGHLETLMHGGFVLAGIILVEQILGFIQLYSTQVVGARAMADVRRHTFRFLHSLRLGFFDHQMVGRLVSRVTNDVDAMLDLFASGAFLAFGDLIKLAGIVALMLALDWKLSLIGFAAMPPVLFFVVFLRRRMRETFRDIRAKTSRMNATMNEQVTGMTVIQAYSRQAAASRDFDAANVGYRQANLRAILWDALQDAAIDTVAAICLASIVVSLGYRPVSFGTVVAFTAYLTQFFEPISTLAQRYTLLQSALTGAERVFRLLDTDAPDARPVTNPKPAGDATLAVSFEDVSFSYKAKIPVLSHVSFRAKRGEKIALVGPTGSGKTTITGLLLRLYEADAGTIRVDGDDIRGLSREQLRRRFAVVPQDVILFPGTIATNIAAGETPDRTRVEEVLRRIGAEKLAQRPGGIDAPVDEHGHNFSGGERQLIAFARALYRDAPILILDEATASIDSDTESRLQHALSELLRGRTALIIAHRLSTVRAADRILVVQRGKIVEEGSHEELLQKGGLYTRLHDLQFARKAGPEGEQTPGPESVRAG
jgi:ATP-binding cassette subfamily B multidrug efflux pump